MSHCIITGCRLVMSGERKSLWGDLHSVGDALVFSGVTHDVITGVTRERYAKWEYVFPKTTADERMLIVNEGADYFERRGIVTVQRCDTEFNQAAKAYLGDR